MENSGWAMVKDYWGIFASLAALFAGIVAGREKTRMQVESVSDRIGMFEERLKEVEAQGRFHAMQLSAMQTQLDMLPEMRGDIKRLLERRPA